MQLFSLFCATDMFLWKLRPSPLENVSTIFFFFLSRLLTVAGESVFNTERFHFQRFKYIRPWEKWPTYFQGRRSQFYKTAHSSPDIIIWTPAVRDAKGSKGYWKQSDASSHIVSREWINAAPFYCDVKLGGKFSLSSRYPTDLSRSLQPYCDVKL